MTNKPARTMIAAATLLGAALAATGQAAADTLCGIDGGSVYFSQNEAELTEATQEALTRIAAEARACNAAAVLVRTGAGDLADERAEVIATSLAAKGVNVTRAVSLPAVGTADESFVQARVATIELRAPGQSVS